MIRHLFTLMWNRRRANALLMLEIFLAFVVLFAVGTIGTGLWQRYREPLGFTYAHVWQLSFSTGTQPRAEAHATLQQVLATLRAVPGVVGIAQTNANTPFSYTNSINSVDYTDPQQHLKRPIQNFNIFQVSPELREVMGLQLVAGRWFDQRDAAPGAYPPLVIDERLQRLMLPDGRSALGQLLPLEGKPSRVVGIIKAYRADGELAEPVPALFQVGLAQDTAYLPRTLLLRVQPGSGAVLEKRLTDELRRIGPGWSSTIRTLPEMHESQLKSELTRPVLLSVMSLFLLINVALGLFGVLWLAISARRAELGVRRALGAPAGAIARLIVGETLALTTFGLVLGLLVAAQFPLLSVFNIKASVYLTSMALATVGLYALATFCALYPSQLAARIQPAVALREE